MKFFLFVYFILSVLLVDGQAGKKQHGIGKRNILGDTEVLKKLERVKDSVNNPIQYQDSARIKEEADRNINAILDLQKEQKSTQKKAALTRIAIGAALLVVLIIGLARRRKKIK